MFILFIILASGFGLYSLLTPPEEKMTEINTDALLSEQLVVSSIRTSERNDRKPPGE
ncbi:hypothetical protein [Paenibacillus dakarensis]|uniref:hypothetical protein n=1 Tax=Paenibacillus dakarensis TaxID=1527293 RepID=UPI000A9513CA|nr:hypothetical protein [Paenibacillus dakarensis]